MRMVEGNVFAKDDRLGDSGSFVVAFLENRDMLFYVVPYGTNEYAHGNVVSVDSIEDALSYIDDMSDYMVATVKRADSRDTAIRMLIEAGFSACSVL